MMLVAPEVSDCETNCLILSIDPEGVIMDVGEPVRLLHVELLIEELLDGN